MLSIIIQDEDAELTKMEKEQEAWMKSYTKLSCPPPIGTQNQEPMEDDELEEEEEDDDHDNEDSDSRVEDDVEFDDVSPVNVLPS